MHSTVVIGMGNPLLSDDGLGPRVIDQLEHDYPAPEGVVYKSIGVGGLALMTELIGFERAIIVDAMVTGSCRPGSVSRLELDTLASTRNIDSTHDANLGTALQMGQLLGLHLPSEVEVWGVEAEDVETFGEALSPKVASALPRLITEVRRFLSGHGGETNEKEALKRS